MTDPVQKFLGRTPLRIALAGGWIDQPFVSRHNPAPPGSMVVVSLVPNFRPMDRAGFATGTRAVAQRLWKGRLPRRRPDQLVRELYAAENEGRADPSGSQDMIGIVYPGISRLDYDARVEDGVFPAHIESLTDRRTAAWLERVLHILPVEPRPDGYYPLGRQNLDPRWIARLGRTGRDCFEAIRRRDLHALGRAFNECMRCWEFILPDTVQHPTLRLDLKAMLRAYQRKYPGAMFSGCGGGYLFVLSEEPVPGSFQIRIRTQ